MNMYATYDSYALTWAMHSRILESLASSLSAELLDSSNYTETV